MSNTEKPTVKSLVLEGKTPAEIIEITRCAMTTIYQMKYNLRKEGLLKEETVVHSVSVPASAQNSDGSYKCSEVIKKCKYSCLVGGSYICDYISCEKHSRGCPPEACTKFEKKTKNTNRNNPYCGG